MKTELEQMCFAVDDVLANHNLTAKVIGGYISATGTLLALDDATFVNTMVRQEIKRALHVDGVAATIGTILITEPKPYVIEGCYEVVEPFLTPPMPPPRRSNTVDLLDLIAAHHKEEIA